MRDVQRLEGITLRAAVRVSGRVRARLIESMKSGVRFHVAPYLTQQLKPIFVQAMLASHVNGYRRTNLIFKQTPGLMAKLIDKVQTLLGQGVDIHALLNSPDKQILQLSELSDALKILQKKQQLDLDLLQKQYDTQALKVLNNLSKDVEDAVNETFTALVEEGAHVSEAVDRLGAKFDELGLSPMKPYQLEAIFRTQLAMSFAAGRWQAEQSPDIQEILWGYKYVTVGDDRVREEHQALEGTILPKDDPFWNRFYPPNGWNCRCQAIPIFEQREEVKPPEFDDNGNKIEPDNGFDFNPGKVFVG
jgi:SPP1 gp7 family putative phage head morphogenesis protein